MPVVVVKGQEGIMGPALRGVAFLFDGEAALSSFWGSSVLASWGLKEHGLRSWICCGWHFFISRKLRSSFACCGIGIYWWTSALDGLFPGPDRRMLLFAYAVISSFDFIV